MTRPNMTCIACLEVSPGEVTIDHTAPMGLSTQPLACAELLASLFEACVLLVQVQLF